MIGSPLGLAAFAAARAAFSPLSLTALIDQWDAERTAEISLSGSAVTAWRTSKNGYSADQAATNNRPSWSATAINGRPGVTPDGVDDFLNYEGVGLFPTGGNPCEIWALVDQVLPASDTTARILLNYGGTGTSTRRNLQRVVTTGVNRAQAIIGNGSTSGSPTNANVDLSGRNVIRCLVGASTSRVDVNGNAGANVTVTPATGTTRTRLFAANGGTPANFFQGVVNYIGVFNPLTDPEAAQMLAFLKARGGIP